jgi:hypothetical protein
MASENEVQEDFLEVDQKIPGQNFVCLSFISPEKVLKDKQKFLNTEFFKYVFQSGDKTILERLSNPELGYEQLDSIYEDWLYPNKDRLETEFYEKNDFRTSVRGIKVRGTYETLKEANIRAKVLQKRDPSFHVFVGQVGYWLPWDPESDKVENQEYQETHLNDLVKNYKQNLEQRDEYFETVKNEKIRKAKEEVEKLKAEMENLPDKVESENKITELRDIMDERDKFINEAELQAKTQEQSQDSSELTQNNAAQEVVQENVATELAGTDPWLQRKQEASEQSSEQVVEESSEQSSEQVVAESTTEQTVAEVN